MALRLTVLFLVVSLLFAVPAFAQARPILERVSLVTVAAAGEWPHVRVSDPSAAMALRHGLDTASRLLDDAECQTLLTEFQTGEGQPLTAALLQMSLGIQDYLRFVYFFDGSQHPACSTAVAYTAVSGRVVFVCAKSLERHWRSNRNHVVFALVHEVLHTLGLGENPPSSPEITYRVRNRCWSALAAAR
ncbi:MAG TPA: hypothetical protein VLA20_11270 [Vicinamibacterales bacterium]|nr:hypothetical protein [Vicinamibacterales bacterium]